MIKCENVKFGFNENELLLKGVNVNISKGKIAVLLGLNGCGKSTLLNCIGGNHELNGGTIDTDPNCKLINSLPDFSKNLTGIEYIELLVSLSSKIYLKDVNEFIDTLGIRKVLSKKIENCIDYTKSLLLMLSSLCIDSDTILLDDPFSNIDRQSQKKLIKIINKLKETGKTVLIATNIIYTGFDIADEIIILHRGKTKQFNNIFKSIKQYESKIMPLLMC